jgi:hypothetical protein
MGLTSVDSGVSVPSKRALGLSEGVASPETPFWPTTIGSAIVECHAWREREIAEIENVSRKSALGADAVKQPARVGLLAFHFRPTT